MTMIRKSLLSWILAASLSAPSVVLPASVRAADTGYWPSGRQPFPDSCSSGGNGGDSPRFLWPAAGRLVLRGRPASAGVDLAMPSGTPIGAIGAGLVVYVGARTGTYSNLIIVRQREAFFSLYANVVDSRVRRGDRVERGQIIARLGTPDGPMLPLLHVELRHHGRSVDPRCYLPCR